MLDVNRERAGSAREEMLAEIASLVEETRTSARAPRRLAARRRCDRRATGRARREREQLVERTIAQRIRASHAEQKNAMRRLAASAPHAPGRRSKPSWGCSFRSSRSIPRPTKSAPTSKRAIARRPITSSTSFRACAKSSRDSKPTSISTRRPSATKSRSAKRFCARNSTISRGARATLLESIAEIERDSQAQFNQDVRDAWRKRSRKCTRASFRAAGREDVANRSRKSLADRHRDRRSAAREEADADCRALRRRTRDDGGRADLCVDRNQAGAVLSARRSRCRARRRQHRAFLSDGSRVRRRRRR